MTTLTADQREKTLSYIGRITEATKQGKNPRPIGMVVCASVDDLSMLKENAKTIPKWIKDGLAIERVPVWWVRLHFGSTAVYREGDQPPVAEKAA